MSYEARVLVLARNAPSIGAVLGGRIVEGLGKTFRCDDSTPSIHGSDWLGHEGELVRYAYVKTTTDTAVVAPAPAPVVATPAKTVSNRGRYSTHHEVAKPRLAMVLNVCLENIFARAFGDYPDYRHSIKSKSARMRRAWELAGDAAKYLGGSPRQYIAAAMRAVAAAHRCAVARTPVAKALEITKTAFKGA